MSSHACISDQIDLNLSSLHGISTPCIQMCHGLLDKTLQNHNMTCNHHHCLSFQMHNTTWNHLHCLSFHRLFQRLSSTKRLFQWYWAHVHQKHAEKGECFQNETSYKHRKTTATCLHSSSEAPDVWPWPWQNLLTYLGDLRNLLSGNMIHRVLSQRVLSSLSYQVLSHNIFRDNCCNWTTTTTSVSFGLFRFSAVSVHSVSSVHGAQVHRCWSRIFHTTLVLWKQTDFQPPCSLRNLQRKFQFLQKQSTLLSIAKDCLPTSFQKGVSWDHIQRNSYHYYTLHGNLRLTYLGFQIYNPFDRQIIVSCTLQAWRWTRILKTHSVVLDPLLRNDVACSPWVYQPAGLRISYPYTTYKILQCAAQVVCHRSLSTRCPCGPLWPTSIWSSLHCKGFDYHSSLVSTLLLNFWFLRLLSLTRLFTFFNFSKLSSFPSTFATAFAAFALCSRLCLGLCRRLGSWGSSRSFAGILGPAVLSCMTWLAAMAAFHRLWAITSKVSTFAAVVASDTFRTLLCPCCHMKSAVQVIGESHSSVVRDHRLPNPGNSSGTTVELNIFCHLLW